MIMNELLGKITSYNLFNYLLPGILFVVILDKFTNFSFTQENLVIGAFVYYFVGLIISRFGSLIVEPVLKKVSFIKFAEHQDFVSSSRQDPKIETLLEASNMYRTFTAMFFLLLLFKLYNFLSIEFPILNESSIYTLIALLLVMFLFSYRKQTEYISKRVKANNQ